MKKNRMEAKMFKLHSEYKPTGDQPQAIAEVVEAFADYKLSMRSETKKRRSRTPFVSFLNFYLKMKETNSKNE